MLLNSIYSSYHPKPTLASMLRRRTRRIDVYNPFLVTSLWSISQVVTLFVIARGRAASVVFTLVAKPNHSFIAFLGTHTSSNLNRGRINRTRVWSLPGVFGYGCGALHITCMVHSDQYRNGDLARDLRYGTCDRATGRKGSP